MQKTKMEQRHQKQMKQIDQHINKRMDSMLENFQNFSSVQDELLTVVPRRFESHMVLD